VLSKDLTGPLPLFVSSATLKDYGVDKVFELENNNTDSSQRNIVYLVRGEKAATVQAVVGKNPYVTGRVYTDLP
jgi:vacuolar protein sorting-associated protein 33A